MDTLPPDFGELCARWQCTVGFTEQALASADSHETYKPPADPGACAVPSVEQGFRKLQQIGSGGQGVVFRAVQNDLKREVAVKQLLPGRVQAQHAQFLRESFTTGQLEHPNILPIHRLDCTTEDQPSLVMKLVAGKSWQEHLQSQPADLNAQLEILIQVCNAVAYAHSQGIVHNDLKPANVMLGKFGEVLVLDWGLAADLRGDRPWLRAADSITDPCGTPCYSPPELTGGRGDRVGPWTDAYLLGGILFHLLTGRPPHGGDTLLANLRERCGPGELSFGPDTPPDELVALCRTALDPNPQARPDAEAFREALRDYLRHAQSLQVSRDARTLLGSLAEPAPNAQRAETYERYNQAIAGFQQAQKLWPGNTQAAAGVLEARAALARTALSIGDLQLARTQALRLPAAQGTELLDAVAAQQAQRVRERRNRKWLRRTVLGLAAALLGGLLLGLLGLRAKNRELRLDRALEVSHHRLRQLGDRLAVQHDTATLARRRREVRDQLTALAALSQEYPQENAVHWLRGRAHALLHEADAAVEALTHALDMPDSSWSREVGVRTRAHAMRAKVHIEGLLVSTLAYSHDVLARQGAHARAQLLPAVREDLRAAGRDEDLALLMEGWQALLDGEGLASEIVTTLQAQGGPSPEAAALAALVAVQEQWWSSRDALDRALDRDGNQPLLLLARARVAWREGARDQAWADVERGLFLQPELVAARQLRVQMLVDALRFDEALQALACDDPIFVFGIRAEIALKQGDFDAALSETEKVLELDPAQRGARRLRAQAFRAAGQLERAIDELSTGLELGGDFQILALRAELLEQAGRTQAALGDITRMLELAPRRPLAWRLLGSILRKQGELDEALDCFSRVLLLDPRDQLALFERARLQADNGQPREALADLDRLLTLEPHHKDALVLRLRLWREQGDLQRALEDVNALLAQEASFELLNQRLEIHRGLKQWRGALEDLAQMELLDEAESSAFEILYMRADLLALLGELEASLQMLENARLAARNDEQRRSVDGAQEYVKRLLEPGD